MIFLSFILSSLIFRHQGYSPLFRTHCSIIQKYIGNYNKTTEKNHVKKERRMWIWNANVFGWMCSIFHSLEENHCSVVKGMLWIHPLKVPISAFSNPKQSWKKLCLKSGEPQLYVNHVDSNGLDGVLPFITYMHFLWTQSYLFSSC